MASLRDVYTVMSSFPLLLDHLTLSGLHLAITVLSRLKNDILAAQPPSHDPNIPPPALPIHIATFVAEFIQIDTELVEVLWHAIKSTVWALDEGAASQPVWSDVQNAQLCTPRACTTGPG